MEDKESEYLTEELAGLARRSVSPELVREFESCLSEADRLYEETWRSNIEQQIRDTKARETIREPVRDKISLGLSQRSLLELDGKNARHLLKHPSVFHGEGR